MSSLVSIGPAIWPAIRKIDYDKQTDKQRLLLYRCQPGMPSQMTALFFGLFTLISFICISLCLLRYFSHIKRFCVKSYTNRSPIISALPVRDHAEESQLRQKPPLLIYPFVHNLSKLRPYKLSLSHPLVKCTVLTTGVFHIRIHNSIHCTTTNTWYRKI